MSEREHKSFLDEISPLSPAEIYALDQCHAKNPDLEFQVTPRFTDATYRSCRGILVRRKASPGDSLIKHRPWRKMKCLWPLHDTSSIVDLLSLLDAVAQEVRTQPINREAQP